MSRTLLVLLFFCFVSVFLFVFSLSFVLADFSISMCCVEKFNANNVIELVCGFFRFSNILDIKSKNVRVFLLFQFLFSINNNLFCFSTERNICWDARNGMIKKNIWNRFKIKYTSLEQLIVRTKNTIALNYRKTCSL